MTNDRRLPAPDVVTVYGVDTCEDTTRAREHFDAAGMSYLYVSYDLDPGAAAVVRGAGYGNTPVVLTPDGGVFMEPTDEELAGIVTSVTAGEG